METPIINSHPKPLAFTLTAGGILFPRAIYRSQEIWDYCLLTNPDNTSELFSKYLEDASVVIIDDATLLLERLENPIITNTSVETQEKGDNVLNVEEELIRLINEQLYESTKGFDLELVQQLRDITNGK